MWKQNNCWFMGLNKSLVLSYNRSVIYGVPIKTGKFLHGGGSHWFPFGGLKSDFLFHKLERKPRVSSALWIQGWSSPLSPLIPAMICAHESSLDPVNPVISHCSELTASTCLSTVELEGGGHRMKADNSVSGTEKLRRTQVQGLRKTWRWRSRAQKNSSFLKKRRRWGQAWGADLCVSAA